MSAPIGIVGSGSVAQALGRLLCERHQPVVAVSSRSVEHARRAAAFIGHGVEARALDDLARRVGRVLIATTDSGITSSASGLAEAGFASGIALHTCGSRGAAALEPLRRTGVACGVLHPLQTISSPEQGVTSLTAISFGLSGDVGALNWGRELIAALGGRELAVAEDRLAEYHAGAVMASNAMISVVDAALTLMQQAGLEPAVALSAVEPLCRTTLDNLFAGGPAAALTGPIVRGDIGTIRQHRTAIMHSPDRVSALYRAAGHNLLQLARERGLPEATLQAMAAALDGSRAEE